LLQTTQPRLAKTATRIKANENDVLLAPDELGLLPLDVPEGEPVENVSVASDAEIEEATESRA